MSADRISFHSAWDTGRSGGGPHLRWLDTRAVRTFRIHCGPRAETRGRCLRRLCRPTAPITVSGGNRSRLIHRFRLTAQWGIRRFPITATNPTRTVGSSSGGPGAAAYRCRLPRTFDDLTICPLELLELWSQGCALTTSVPARIASHAMHGAGATVWVNIMRIPCLGRRITIGRASIVWPGAN